MAETIFSMSEQYEEFLIDESKFSGYADSISFPESEEEVIAVLKTLASEGIPLTVQGGKTGITGGAVPQGGHIMNLSRMNRVKDSVLNEDGTGSITVEPGINLIDLKKEIQARFRKTPMIWPPEPTETSATVGGIAATGAQGINRLLYGASGNYIEGIRIVDYAGNVTEIHRGEKKVLASGREMDALEAVLGKEGITGIISGLTLRLVAKPESVWGIAFFFEDEENAGQFVDALKEEMPKTEEAAVAAVEYLDRVTINLIEARKETMTKIKELPDVREEVEAMIYVEIHGREDAIEEIAEMLMEAAMEVGSDPDEAWAVSGETDVEKLHAFRHGAAETANLFIEEKHREDSTITKLGTDMVIGDAPFSEVLAAYRADLEEAGLNGCIFGHATQNHLHINLLPENSEEYQRGVELMRKWAKSTKEHSGKLIGEHGIGKLKRKMFGDLIPEEYVSLCRELKADMDAENKLNIGNII